ncbi:MAG: beta-ketoacyl-[acyl-carrier-protein] synthase family protein [Myxococcaceae bacterium]
MNPIAITGLGAVSALGLDVDQLWESLAQGRDGIRPIERFDTSVFTTHLGGMVPVPDRVGVDDAKGSRALCIRFAIEAGREALKRSGVRITEPSRAALVLGTSMGSHLGGLHEASAEVATALGLSGPVITVSTACASSTNALGIGKELLEQGLADVVVAGGSDVLVPEIFTGFHGLGLLSATKCSPFSESMGTTLGEGSGFLVLEREADAQARQATIVSYLSGYALSADGYHATSPEPSGAGVARALGSALKDAALTATDVSYVNAHGTGTPANDASEWQGISAVLGARAATTPVSSTKSYLGHAQGAAGVLEIISTLLAMQHGVVLPTLHFTRARPRGPVDPVAQTTPRVHEVQHALCGNSAFGGANAAVVVSKRAAPRKAVQRPLFVSGFGAVGPFGVGVEALRSGSEGVRLAPFALESIVPTAETRGLDASAKALTGAVGLAVKSAGLQLKGATRERTGLFVGTTNSSPKAWEEFRTSIRDRGLHKASSLAFTKLVLNASAGTASRALGLRGPTTTLTTGQGSGLVALVLALMHLSTRDDADRLVVGAVDEADLERNPERLDAAAALVLSTTEGHWRVAGFGLAGPGQAQIAAARAEATAGITPQLRLERHLDALAAGSLLSCVRALSAPDTTSVLIVDDSIAASAAVLFTRKES